MELQVNPDGIAESYLTSLNACFPNWGDRRTYEWVFDRRLTGEPRTDCVVLSEAGQLVAGSAVSYRKVLLPNGKAIRAGIMTGSWTLPLARGRGCFGRMIEESVRLTLDREGALLLAFVSRDNPSRRQLERAGAALFPSSYLLANMASRAAVGNLEAPAHYGPMNKLFTKWDESRRRFVRFAYPSLEDWRSQVLDRPWNTVVVRDQDRAFAVLEEHPDTYRVNALLSDDEEGDRSFLASLLHRAAAMEKKLFVFSTLARFSNLCTTLGFVEQPGFITGIVANWLKLGEALQITAPHSAPADSSIADPASPWFLGYWNLQSGDRM